MSAGKNRDFEPFEARVVGIVHRPANLIIQEDMRGGKLVVPRDRSVVFDAVVLEGVDLANNRFDHADFRGSRFVGCDFSGIRFNNFVNFDAARPSTFVDCRFERADLRNMWDLSTNRYERCSFKDSKLNGWRSWCGEFVDCKFEGRLENIIFAGRPARCYDDIDGARATAREFGLPIDDSHDAPRRTVNAFQGNDFSAADLVDVEFRYGIDIGHQIWPSGPDYLRFDRWKVRVARSRAVVESWPPSRDRSDALQLLEMYCSGGWEEQLDVFLSRDAFGYRGRYLRDLVAILDAS